MFSIATQGPIGSDSYQAARQYAPDARVLLFNRISDILGAFLGDEADYALVPVYNTREGEIKESFRLVTQLEQGYWIDNVVLPIHLSLGSISGADPDLSGS